MLEYKIFPKQKEYNNNFLTILEYFTKQRLEDKRKFQETGDKYFESLSESRKIMINSGYGFMGAAGLNYNYPEGAAAVTRYGRDVIMKAIIWATGYSMKRVLISGDKKKEEYAWQKDNKISDGKNFIISNCDTDSISFTTGKD